MGRLSTPIRWRVRLKPRKGLVLNDHHHIRESPCQGQENFSLCNCLFCLRHDTGKEPESLESVLTCTFTPVT